MSSQAVREQLRRVFENPASYATTMITVLVDRLGTEFFNWDPEAIRLEIESLCEANTPQENLDKIGNWLKFSYAKCSI